MFALLRLYGLPKTSALGESNFRKKKILSYFCHLTDVLLSRLNQLIILWEAEANLEGGVECH